MHGLVNRMSKDFGLCKAKNEYGKWVLGYIIWLNDKPFIVSEIKDRTKEFMLNTIQPDTICRYAGIVDSRVIYLQYQTKMRLTENFVIRLCMTKKI